MQYGHVRIIILISRRAADFRLLTILSSGLVVIGSRLCYVRGVLLHSRTSGQHTKAGPTTLQLQNNNMKSNPEDHKCRSAEFPTFEGFYFIVMRGLKVAGHRYLGSFVEQEASYSPAFAAQSKPETQQTRRLGL